MVTALILPRASAGSVGHYLKFSRVDGDYAIVSIGVTLTLSNGVCTQARLAAGGLGSRPLWCAEADAALCDTRCDDPAISRAARHLLDIADPVDDVRASADYRRALLPKLLRRAVRNIVSRQDAERRMDSAVLNVNGRQSRVSIDGHETLLEVLRTQLGLTGAKRGCNQGVCGSCTVLINGLAARACLCLAALAVGKQVVTVEGLERDGQLSPVQQAFVEAGAVQCGFCMPGMVVAATALLSENSEPNEEAIRVALAGNLCRCSGYVKVIDAVRRATKLGQSQ